MDWNLGLLLLKACLIIDSDVGVVDRNAIVAIVTKAEQTSNTSAVDAVSVVFIFYFTSYVLLAVFEKKN